MLTPARRLLAALLYVSLAAACGGKSPTSPSPADPGNGSPAPAPAPAPTPTGSATVTGQVVSQASPLGMAPLAGLSGVTVTVAGTSLSAVGDDNGRFSLSNVPSGDQQLEFTGHGANARLKLEQIAERETIQVTVAVTGGSAQLVEEERVNGAESQLEGRIASINSVARSVVVRGVTVQVPASASIRHGATALTFSNLHVDDQVHVKGTKSGSVVTASEVNVQQGEDTPGGPNAPDPDETATVQGAVSGLTGTCPALTFTVQGKTVTTTSATDFRKGKCAQVVNGTHVEAEGVLTGNTLAASKVQLEK